MKYKDYYEILGSIGAHPKRTSRRPIAGSRAKYHPDVSKEKNAEEKFKEVGEAYEVLKTPRSAPPTTRSAGSAGAGFPPSAGLGSASPLAGKAAFGVSRISATWTCSTSWQGSAPARLRAIRRRPTRADGGPGRGSHAEAPASRICCTARSRSALVICERGADGRQRRVTHATKVRIPKGATDGQRLRVPARVGREPAAVRLETCTSTSACGLTRCFRVSGHDVIWRPSNSSIL